MKPDKLKCPACCSEAVYRYGHIHSGKQRLRCMMCGRQFVLGDRLPLKSRPVCPECGGQMHLYRHDKTVIRFRCAEYPECRTYTTVPITTEANANEVLCS